MEKPKVIECADGHYRRVIWGLGPYIGDYPEQTLLTCVVQGWCPRLARAQLLVLRLIILCRCRAFPGNLDNENEYQRRRTKDITEALIYTYNVPILWSEHGIISDVVVRLLISHISPQSLTYSQPFTNDFPRADIHELIAPDLLHQIIKGTFKDHLVTWVEEFLVITHGRRQANRILDDIDHR